MMQQILILCAGTFAFWWCFQKGEILGRIQTLFAALKPSLKKPLFDCPVCMHFWYGTLFYWLIYGADWRTWLIVVIAGVGVNAVMVKLWPCCNE